MTEKQQIDTRALVEGSRAEIGSLIDHINFDVLRLKELADLFDDIVNVASDVRDRLRDAGDCDRAA